jgi:hypothetical protein
LPIKTGVPQGSVPLLFLLYINDIACISDLLLFILFADDTNILYSNSNLSNLFKNINKELKKLADWFCSNKLSLNVKKTCYISFGFKNIAPTSITDPELSVIAINSTPISRVESTKFLGVLVDEKLTWRFHINHIATKIACSLGMLSKVKRILPRNNLLTLYYSLIYPHLNYCISIWGNTFQIYLNKLLTLQKRAVRLINCSFFRSHTNPIFIELRILKLPEIYKLSCLIFIYRYLANDLPSICRSLFLLRTYYSSATYYTRNNNQFVTPKYRTSVRGKCIAISGTAIWATIPAELKLSYSLLGFKSKLRTFFLSKYIM